MVGGRIWQVGCTFSGPPLSAITVFRSIASLMAFRAASLSKGAIRVFSVSAMVVATGPLCSWLV